MNIEQTKEAIKVMQAFVDGKEVEVLYPFTQAQIATTPVWNWDANKYRIKPTATLRPWTADEVPLGAWMRSKKSNGPRFLLSSTRNDAYRIELMSDHEHSTDGGVTWKPCGVVEEAK